MNFSEELINWYKDNKRDLPWRNTTNPYIIWLSEIILQQTRVDQGLSYFNAFLGKYPTINDLATAKEEEVLKLWQGLGYYSRARNLHFTAKYIANELNGNFPKEYKDILKLKGVGEYTAAAIASFAYQLPYPVIDGNVYRVLSRIFGIKKPIDSTNGKKAFKELAFELINHNQPDTYNQAIMEFGALHCTPKNPSCEDCIFRLECIAYKNDLVENLPVKEKKIKQKNRYFNYLVFKYNENTYIKQRQANDIWKGLFDFPLVETEKSLTELSELLELSNGLFNLKTFTLKDKSEPYKHILSHQKIHTTFWEIEIDDDAELNNFFLKIDLKKINNYPVPKLIENYIKRMV